jgi:hypothetical protein
VRGTLGESEFAESPPHPDLLRASYARLEPASGEKEKKELLSMRFDLNSLVQ